MLRVDLRPRWVTRGRRRRRRRDRRRQRRRPDLALAHGRRAAAWVQRLDPDADDAQLLAARAHHLRRGRSPRVDYPEGRAGLPALAPRRQGAPRRRGRRRCSAAAGYDDDDDRPGAGARPQGGPAARDPAAQVHEDAACLVFLETQLDALADQLGDDQTVEVLRQDGGEDVARPAWRPPPALPLSARGRVAAALGARRRRVTAP